MEIWKKFRDWDYSVSSYGVVKSHKTDRTLVGGKDQRGYRHVGLRHNGKSFTMIVHRMVAELFCDGFSFERTKVNHKDGDKNNNKSLNLEWVTNQENIDHARKNNLFGNNFPVQVTNILSGKIKTFNSCSDAAKELKLQKSTICRALKRSSKTHKNFIFERLEYNQPRVSGPYQG